MLGELSLAKACQGADTASSHQRLGWSELIAEFRLHRPQASEATWRRKYAPVLGRLQEVLEGKGKRPADGTALCMAVLERWEQGSRQRQIMR
jgi:hypothetical protein